jgi:hypothetical protein
MCCHFLDTICESDRLDIHDFNREYCYRHASYCHHHAIQKLARMCLHYKGINAFSIHTAFHENGAQHGDDSDEEDTK